MSTLHTPVYGFPYPDGSERVMDGDNAMGALGLAIENAIIPIDDIINRLIPQARASNADLVLTQTLQNIPGTALSVNPAVPEVLIVWSFFDFQISAADTGILNGMTMLDGVVMGLAARYYAGPAGTGRATVGMVYVSNIAVGVHNLVLQAQKVNATGTATAINGGCRIATMRIPQL